MPLWIGAVAIWALPALACGEAAYTVTDLGTFGGSVSSARAVNNAGQVIGWVLQTPPPSWNYLWDPEGGVTNLNGLLGARTGPADINDLGEIAYVAHLGVPEEQHAFLWDGVGASEDLGAFGPLRMNNTGMVVGTVDGETWRWHTVVWDREDGFRDIGALSSDAWSYPYDVNDLGEVVGESTTALAPTGHPFVQGEIDPEVQHHPFLWSETGGMQDLGTLGGDFARARGINNASHVVGVSYLGGASSAYRAFLWDDGSGMWDLGVLPGHESSDAWAINESGEIVGMSYAANGKGLAFLWDEQHGMRALRDLVPADVGWTAFLPIGINDLGQIVGNAEYDDPEEGWASHAVILTPVPEPATLAQILLVAWVLIGKRSGRRTEEAVRRRSGSGKEGHGSWGEAWEAQGPSKGDVT